MTEKYIERLYWNKLDR